MSDFLKEISLLIIETLFMMLTKTMVKFKGNDSLSNELYRSVNDNVLKHAFAGGGGGAAGPEGGGGHAAGEAEAAHLRHHQRPRGHRPHREAEQELHPVDVS